MVNDLKQYLKKVIHKNDLTSRATCKISRPSQQHDLIMLFEGVRHMKQPAVRDGPVAVQLSVQPA